MKKVGVSQAVEDEVALILNGLQGLSKEKIGVLFVKSASVDKKFNAFLKADFGKKLGIFVDAEKREKYLEAVSDYGMTDNTRKKAILIGMLRADVEQQVKETIAEITLDGNLPISADQQKALDSKTIEYRNFLTKKLSAGIVDLGLYVGAFEVHEEAEQPAVLAD